ncbi:MAG: type II secretion system protein [Lentisphaeraceae bacterium]|nr:type II secretion system protein [Lentisphaeraceae bacterium]
MKLNQAKLFTLIELLVVVAIIGILASILLPSLSKARKSVKTAVCLSNLSSLGTAVQVFMLDGNLNKKTGIYPPYYGWTTRINKLAGTKLTVGSNNTDKKTHGKYWQCPASERPQWPMPLRPGRVSYGMNEILHNRPQHTVRSPSETILIGETWGKGLKDNHLKKQRVKAWHGSKMTIVFVDGHAASAEWILAKQNSTAPYIQVPQK